MSSCVYQFERNRFSRRYTITSLDKPTLLAVRDSGVGRGLLVIFLGLMGFLVCGVVATMLAVMRPNLSINMICGILGISTIVLIFYFWPARNIRFFDLVKTRQPLWILREEKAYLPDVIRSFVLSATDLPAYQIQNWAHDSNRIAYWDLKQPDGKPLIRVVLADSSVAVRRASVLVTSDNRGLNRFLDFQMIIPETSTVIADLKWQLAWQDKHQLLVHSADTDHKLLLSLAMIVGEGYS